MTFPVGVVNLVNYSWHDLTEGAYKYASKNSISKKHNALQRDLNATTIVDLKGDKISSSSKECHKENHLVKAKKHHHVVSSKSMDQVKHVSRNY